VRKPYEFDETIAELGESLLKSRRYPNTTIRGAVGRLV
jgi:hypothetical protein